MRTTHRFRPDVLDSVLEGRQVLAQLTALAPFDTMFGVGMQDNSGAAVVTPALTTGFSSPLYNSFVSTGNGLDGGFSNPNYLDGLGVNGLGMLGGSIANPGGFVAFSPISSLALNGGLLGVGAAPQTTGVASFTGANYAPTSLAVQSGLYPTLLQPAGGLAYYSGTGFVPFTPPSMYGSNFYASNYTNGVGYLNGLGVAGGLSSGFNSGVAPLGLYGLNGSTLVNSSYGFNPGIDLTTGGGIATTANFASDGDILDLSPGASGFTSNPYVGSVGLGTSFTTDPYGLSAFGMSSFNSPGFGTSFYNSSAFGTSAYGSMGF